MAHQTNLVTFVLIARIPTESFEDFRAYEDAVLPLVPEFNGCLERRLRNRDGTMSALHPMRTSKIIGITSAHGASRLLEKSSAKPELLPMKNV